MPKKPEIRILEQFKETNYGQRGTPKRITLEQGFGAFKSGALLLGGPAKKKPDPGVASRALWHKQNVHFQD
jgi:hypothetical protein